MVSFRRSSMTVAGWTDTSAFGDLPKVCFNIPAAGNFSACPCPSNAQGTTGPPSSTVNICQETLTFLFSVHFELATQSPASVSTKMEHILLLVPAKGSRSLKLKVASKSDHLLMTLQKRKK